jgi:hypothetical protein
MGEKMNNIKGIPYGFEEWAAYLRPVAYLRGGRPDAIGVRAVLAGVYRGNRGRRGGMGPREGQATLTHAVACNAAGEEIRVLCAGVKLESLCDVAESGPPTCPTCARRAAK